MNGDHQQRVLHVENLDQRINETFVSDIFSAIGPVKDCSLVTELKDHSYCFIEFEDYATAARALQAMNGRTIHNKKLKVNWATNNGVDSMKRDEAFRFANENSESNATVAVVSVAAAAAPPEIEASGNNVADSSGSSSSSSSSSGDGDSDWQNASSSSSSSSSSSHQLFVGDLNAYVDVDVLTAAFSAKGRVSDVRVLKDPVTGRPKGYGFVSFVNREDAETAKKDLDNSILCGRYIRVNWASRKNTCVVGGKPLDYHEIYRQSPVCNTSVYIGNITVSTTEEHIRSKFGQYGPITEVRVFADKGYAFTKFESHEQATKAIMGCNSSMLNGSSLRCSWGREESRDAATPQWLYYQQQLQTQQQQQQQQQHHLQDQRHSSYYYNYQQPSQPYAAQAAAAAAAANTYPFYYPYYYNSSGGDLVSHQSYATGQGSQGLVAGVRAAAGGSGITAGLHGFAAPYALVPGQEYRQS